MEAHPWIVPLKEADGAESVFGGKAANLARLAQAGFRVAPGFCISIEAYEQFLEANRLGAVIQMELGRKPLDQMRWEEIWDAALRIRNRFLNSAVADDLTRSLSEWVVELGTEIPLAVRSSAPGEDSADRSFAGLHESYLNVVGTRAVCDAVRLVWASLWSDAALLYRKELCLDPTKSRMAVLVQVMQKEDCSGVAFGCDPRNGDRDRAIIEAVPGVCADLVDGNTDPDRWVFVRSSRQLIESRRGDSAERNADRDLLARTDLHALLEVIDRVEEVMGWPPDMEWTGRRERLALLQARPVTQAGSCAADADDQRPWYLTLRPGRQRLKDLCDRVAGKLIPELERTGDGLAAEDLDCLDDQALAGRLVERKSLIDHWKKIYWDEFIPMAHGVRYLGLYYNDAVRPVDPYEFVELLRGEEMLAAQRNQSMREVARLLITNAPARNVLERAIETADSASTLDQFLNNAMPSVSGGQAWLDAFNELRRLYLDIAFDGVRLADRPGALLGTVLELSSKIGAEHEEDASDKTSADDLEKRLLDEVGPEREEEAREVLRLGRLSWKLRDDDNILVARLESQLLRALDLAMERLKGAGRVDADAETRAEHLDLVCSALRDFSQGPLVLPKAEVSECREAASDAAEKPRQLIGQPAAIGIARGRVRIVRSASDLEKFRAGEILVCDAIQPMMTHLVPLACAVIERRGGMLIHGAIIARELGIPCVNGIARLTELLEDGLIVTVDGHLGIVTVGEPELDLELRG
ncbi:MAG: PEP/pyruvate-binding domain-containing protein [Thermoguttaceae bacterium]